MKLSTKIANGYGLVIVIALILGGMAVYNMNRVKSDSRDLANLFVPGVSMEYELESSFRELLFTVRGYSYTGNDSFYIQAEQQYKKIEEIIEKAEKHAGTDEKLSAMKDGMHKIKENITKYNGFIKASNEIFGKVSDARKALDLNAAAFMKVSGEYLEHQDKAMKEEFAQNGKCAEQALKILVTGSNVRILNFKYQSLKDEKTSRQLINALETCKEEIEKYRKTARNEAAVTRAENLRKAINAYHESDIALIAEMSKGAAANTSSIEKIRKKMDEIGVNFVKLINGTYDAESLAMTQGVSSRTWKIKLANDVIDVCNGIRVKAFKSQALRNDKFMGSGINDFEKINTMLADLKAASKLEINIKQLDAIKESGIKYKNAMLAYLSSDKEMNTMSSKRLEVALATLSAVNNLSNGGFKRTQKISGDAASLLNSSSLTMIFGLIVAVIVSILLAIFITIGITKSINFVIDGLRRGSEQVTSASEQVSSSSQSLSQGASEQASSLEEISSSLEEMASMTRQNADNAKQANSMSSAASEAARKGAEAMSKMAGAIEKIKGSSDETAKIIKTIDEIAFQTNLLALNAAVEAARAGEAGKGFAVVAEEVRNLAQRSAEAAKNTSYLIEESQNNAEHGVSVSREVDEILSKIVESSVKVAELINEVTAASSEQSQGVDQITKAVQQLDKVTQSNAANAEESASASEELSAQAIELTDMVNQLVKLVDGENATTAIVHAAQSNGSKSLASSKPRKSLQTGVSSRKTDFEKVIPLDDEDFAEF